MRVPATFQQHAAAAPQHQIRYMHAQLQMRCRKTRNCQSTCRAATSAGFPAAAHAGDKQQAVVIGSGIAGLVSAEVLSKYFERVVVVEKDSVQPEWEQSAVDIVKAKGARRGVTQYNHLHGITAGGLESLNTIFQGRYTPAVQAGGGIVVNLLTEGRSVLPKYGATLINHQAKPLTVAFCTRHLFEQTARRLVASNRKVEFMYGTPAAGLEFSDTAPAGGTSSKAVTGVCLRDGRTLRAALVVDASGRHSAAPDWLAAAGFDKPRVSTATANCGYASMLLKLAPHVEAALSAENIKVIYCMAQAPTNTLGILVRVEDGMWMAGMGGYQGKHPPLQDDDKIVEWAQKEVWHPEYGRILAGSLRLAPAVRFFGIGSTWRHYEEAATAGQLPEGLVLLADSICSFNPVYGQGMSVACREVEVLDAMLQRLSGGSTTDGINVDQLGGLSAEFQTAILPLVRSAWDLAVGNDLQFEGAVSNEAAANTSLAAKFQAAYQDALFELATTNPKVHETFMRVMHMAEPPSALVSLAVLSRVVLHTFMKPFCTGKKLDFNILSNPSIISDVIHN